MYQSFPQRHYNRSNTAMPVIKERQEKQCEKEESAEVKCEKEVPEVCDDKKSNPLSSLFGSLELDDIIIIGIILVLLIEGTNDILLLALLGIILFF